MSIIADIKQAKAEYEDHVATHGCRPRTATLADGLEPCEKRVELWHAWMGTAGLWGREPDDDRRQREHYDRNVGRAAA